MDILTLPFIIVDYLEEIRMRYLYTLSYAAHNVAKIDNNRPCGMMLISFL